MATPRRIIRIRRGTHAQWLAANPVLLEGEPAYVTDLARVKIGDGITTYTNLPFIDQNVVHYATGSTPPTNPPIGTIFIPT